MPRLMMLALRQLVIVHLTFVVALRRLMPRYRVFVPLGITAMSGLRMALVMRLALGIDLVLALSPSFNASLNRADNTD